MVNYIVILNKSRVQCAELNIQFIGSGAGNSSFRHSKIFGAVQKQNRLPSSLGTLCDVNYTGPSACSIASCSLGDLYS